MNKIYYSNELYHYGVDGQKWGNRRYQYEDGSLTPEGRIHYGYGQKLARSRANRAKQEYESSRMLAKNKINRNKRRLEEEEERILDYRKRNLEKANRRLANTKKSMNKYVDSMKKKAENREWQANNYNEYKKEKGKKVGKDALNIAKDIAKSAGAILVAKGAFYLDDNAPDQFTQGVFRTIGAAATISSGINFADGFINSGVLVKDLVSHNYGPEYSNKK